MKARAIVVFFAALAGCAESRQSLPATPNVPAWNQPAVVRAPGASGIEGDLYVSNRPGVQYVGSKAVCATWVSVYRAGTAKLLEELPGLCGGRDGRGAVAFDPHGNVYWADYFSGFVLVFAPGKKTPARTIAWGAPGPYSISIDSTGRLYVANLGPFVAGYGRSSVSAYAPGKTVPSYEITNGITYPIFTAVDESGNLYVSNCGQCFAQYPGAYDAATVVEYSPGKKKPSRTLTSGLVEPYAMTVDASGNLYIANSFCSPAMCNGGNVLVYRPGATTPDLTISQNIFAPKAIAVDRAGTVYVSSGSYVTEYAKGQTSVKTTISTSHCQTAALTLDRQQNLYAMLGCDESSPTPNGAVAVYRPGQSTPAYMITRGIDDPKNSFAIAP